MIERLKKLSFYKKKKFYMVLVILFSALLLADVAVGIFVPDQTSFGMPGGSFPGRMEMPEGFSFDEGKAAMPEDSASVEDEMEMPEGFSFGGDEATMPEGFSFGEGEMTMPEGFSFGEGEMQSGGGILQKVKSNWIALAVVLTLLDGLSIFMFVLISRREKNLSVPEIEAVSNLDMEIPKTGKQKSVKKSYPKHLSGIIVAGALVILVLWIQIITSDSGATQSQTEATVYSGTVEKGEVSSVVHGAGTLSDETAVDVELPSEVEIVEWYVNNGDTVEAGEKIAKVDKISVMSGIVSIQEKMLLLDEDLETHENDEISDTISTAASGRVKAVYAEEGTDVLDTMYEHGALIRISLDGLMAVSVETEAEISVGDSVEVELSDGSLLDGKVESYLNGAAVVIMSDDTADYNELVTVLSEEGSEIGKGNLYIHSELKITGFSGKVSDVQVYEGERVSEGETMMVLTNTDYTGEYEALLAQRSKMESQIQTLFQLYQEEYIFAGFTGVISGLNVEIADNADGDAIRTATKAEKAAVKFQILTTGMESSESGISTVQETDEPETSAPETSAPETNTPEINESETSESETSVPETDSTNQNQPGGEQSGLNPPEGFDPEQPEDNKDDEKDQIQTLPNLSSYANTMGIVTSVAENKVNINLISVTGSGASMTPFELTVTESVGVYIYQNGSYSVGTVQSVQSNDIVMVFYEGSTSAVKALLCIRVSGAGSGFDGMDQGGSMGEGMGSGQMPSMGGSTGSFSSGMTDMQTEVMEEVVENNYDVNTTTWLSLIPQEKMEISITVDELDILTLEENQTAIVTLDAFPGQSFEGVVKSIQRSGTNSGGSTKYTAVVAIDRLEDMLSGMNASIRIVTETKEDVLVLPEAALVETENGVYVYTSYDEKTDTLGDMVEVTTGMSDGENVEILAGFEEGSEYWYSILDVVMDMVQ